MPVPIPGLKVGSDKQKVKFLRIFGRPKIRIFREFRGVPGPAPLATNHAALHSELKMPPFLDVVGEYLPPPPLPIGTLPYETPVDISLPIPLCGGDPDAAAGPPPKRESDFAAGPCLITLFGLGECVKHIPTGIPYVDSLMR